MLKGKILRINWDGQWHAGIMHVNKTFDSYGQLHDWLEYILDNVKDRQRKKLLEEDVKKLGVKSGKVE